MECLSDGSDSVDASTQVFCRTKRTRPARDDKTRQAVILHVHILLFGGRSRDCRWAGRWPQSGCVRRVQLLALVVFAVGAVNFMLKTHVNRIRVAQIFFFVLLVVCLIGFGLGLYYCWTIDARIARFCAQDGHTCENTTNLHAWGVLLSLAGTSMWMIFFSVFARSTFLYIVAAERAHLARSPQDGSRIARSVHRIARCLPHYRKIARCILWGIFGMFENSHHCCHHCCHRTHHAIKDFGAVFMMFFCVALCIVSMFLCFALASGVLRDVFCLIFEFLFELFLAILSNKKN